MTKQEQALYEKVLTEIKFYDDGFTLKNLPHREAYVFTYSFLETITRETGCHGYLFIVSVTKLEEKYGDSLTPLMWEILDNFLLSNGADKDVAFAAFYDLGLHFARRSDAEMMRQLLAPSVYFKIFYEQFPLTYEIISRYCGITGMYDRQMLVAKCALKRLEEMAALPEKERTTANGYIESCNNVAVQIAYAAAVTAHLERCYLCESLVPEQHSPRVAEWTRMEPDDLKYMLEQGAGESACGANMHDVDLAGKYVEAAIKYNPAYPKYPYLKARLKFFGELLAGRHINAKCEHEINDLISEAVSKESPSASDYEIRIARYNAFRALVQNHVAVQGSETKFRRSIRAAREKMDILNRRECPPAQDRPPLGYVRGDEYIFISYSTRDFKNVYIDLLEFERRGIRYWYDRGTIPGEKWYEVVEERVKNAACVVCFLSKNFMASEPVYKELSFVLKYDKPVICVDLTGHRRISRAVADVLRNGQKEIAETLTSKKMDVLFKVFDDDADVIARSADPEITVHIDRLYHVLRQKYGGTVRTVQSRGMTVKNSVLYEDGTTRPNEDYYIADNANKVYIVADGISRRAAEYAKYGGESIAARISQLLCEEMGKWLGEHISLVSGVPAAELLMAEAFENANKKIAVLLDSYGGRFDGTERPGCVCLAAFIFDNKLIYGSAGDCMGMLVRGNQTMVFSQKQTTYAFDYLKKEKDRDLLMKSYVNCPENEFGYGVANGDERAKNCFRVSHIDLERGDAVYLVTDGLSDVIQYFKGATINAMSLEEISECAERQAAELGKPYCDDRTIVRIVIDSIKATPEQPENKAMKAG